MVFWSSFSKKIKQAVSQISFDALKKRVDTIEADYATKTYTDTQNNAQDVKIDANTNNITTNTNNITALDTKVDGVITGLKDGNLINYTGVYNAGTTYKLAQATAYNDLWYVSNVDNNLGHTPTGQSDAFWERISAPVVNLQPYLTKTEAATTYISKTDAANQFIVKTMLNTMFPVGSIVMTADNSVHKLVQMYPSKFQELTDSDISFLGFGSGNAGVGNNIIFNINQNNLPNISYRHNHNSGVPVWADDGCRFGEIINSGNKRLGNYDGSTNGSARTDDQTFYLNGNQTQQPVQLSIKPKTLKVRVWKVISDLV